MQFQSPQNRTSEPQCRFAQADRARVELRELGWPDGVPVGGRHGFTAADHSALAAALPGLADGLGVRSAERTLVLGTEELMQLPLRLAQVLADAGHDVAFSTTTRSPAVVVDQPDYALRSGLTFAAHDDPADGPGPRYAYNLGGSAEPPWDHVLVVVDPPADTPALHSGLLAALAPRTRRTTLVDHPVRHPEPLRGPAFGSYAPDEVGWLLTDLSGVALEAPTEEREEAVQSGGAHYAESLPQEYQPDAEYLQLYRDALAGSARRLAQAVGTVTELVLAERGRDVVLVSLARAGTPVGILLRRWAAARHGLELPHYAVSIVRGRGIDPLALRHLAEHHDPARVVFVDGWTGKGAIARELADALAEHGDRFGAGSTPSWSCSPTRAGAPRRSAPATTG